MTDPSRRRGARRTPSPAAGRPHAPGRDGRRRPRAPGTRRGLRAGALATVATVVLAACGLGADPVQNPELSDGDVTLTFSWWGADDRTQMTLRAIELFEEEHPNIEVEPQFSDWNGYWARLATTTAAGDMPDVAQLDQLYLASYAQRGALLDLTTVTNILDTSALSPEIMDTGRVDGTPYAVPTSVTTNGVIINTTLFERYGVPIPDTTTWTWEEMIRAAAELTEASDGAVHGVSPFGFDAFSLTVWARQHGGQLFDADGKLAIDPEVLAGYWQRVLDLIDRGAAPSAGVLSEGVGVPLDQTDLVTGKTAMAFIPATQLIAYQAAAPDFDYALANWPTDADTRPGFQYLKPGMYWAAASTSDHPAEAALLLDFLTNDARVGRIFGLDRGEPGNPAFREAAEGHLDASGKDVLAFSEAMAREVGEPAPLTPNGASDVEVLLTRYYEQILFRDATPKEAAEAFLRELGDSITAAS